MMFIQWSMTLAYGGEISVYVSHASPLIDIPINESVGGLKVALMGTHVDSLVSISIQTLMQISEVIVISKLDHLLVCSFNRSIRVGSNKHGQPTTNDVLRTIKSNCCTTMSI